MKRRKQRPLIFLLLVWFLTACAVPVGRATPTMENVNTTPVIEEIRTTTPPQTPTPLSQEENSPQETQLPPSGWVAYIGYDGNVRLVERAGGEIKQITQDAVLLDPETETEPVRYCCLKWSADGNLLSYLREESIRIENAYKYDYNLLVYDILSGTQRTILPGQNVLGYDWQPGTHLIAYGMPVEQEYWISRDEVRAELAHGIQAVDVDTGEMFELVPPERGFTLGLPRWSSDGRFLSFDEIRQMEGRGLIAYYNLISQEYIAREEETLGAYSWSPDGEWLAYDKIDYRAQGGERIWLSPRDGGKEMALSPEYNPPGYAFAPSFSPGGEEVAFMANFSGLEANEFIFNLFVVEVDGGEPRDYGMHEQVWQLHWTSDGDYLIFSAGPFDQKVVIEVNLEDAIIRQLAQGSEAVPQP